MSKNGLYSFVALADVETENVKPTKAATLEIMYFKE
jgi:hypothetical protein